MKIIIIILLVFTICSSGNNPYRANYLDDVTIYTIKIAGCTFPNDSIFQKSLISEGNNFRIHQFIEKCRSRKKVNVGFIGGSITNGAITSSPSNRFSSLFCEYIKRSFPRIETVHEINAGIAATHSIFASSRVKEDVLQYGPDLVIIEFAVNDWDIADKDNIHMYMEGLVRQCLNYNPAVPVVMVFFAKGDGTNVQSAHIDIGLHYSLPMISYRDVIWPIIQKDTEKNWSLFFHDDPHPNDNGHKVCASLLYSYLKSEMEKPVSKNVAVPGYKYSDLFEKTYVLHSFDSFVIKNSNWMVETREKMRLKFKTNPESSNSVLSFSTNAEEVSFGIRMQKKDTSSIIVEWNNEKRIICNYAPIEYTKFFGINPGSSKTCTVTHNGSNVYTIEYVLLSD
jgi:lysophospholipase L1-like esterase